jgi:hypothetical protein
MVFGNYPSFEEIMAEIKAFEIDLNKVDKNSRA